jgi:dTDP-4-dehydrorhamnose reductase
VSRGRPVTLITGAQGQLGQELCAIAPADWQVIAYGSRELDITDSDAVAALCSRERPGVVIHAAAYTKVDEAERQPARAEAVNSVGAATVARAARDVGARMVYVSTDFVFDGRQGRPYTPDDMPNPLNVYGRTKRSGEIEVLRISNGDALVVRTAWVYSARGDNFVRTMLRLMREQDSLSVVSDQIGTPTWARSLAEALWVAAASASVHGIVHWTDAGVASWYDFAIAIQEEALELGALKRALPIRPIRSDQFPRPAQRPAYSVLDKTTGWAALGPARHWRTNLRCMLQELTRG